METLVKYLVQRKEIGKYLWITQDRCNVRKKDPRPY